MTAVFPTILAVLLGLSFEEFYAESAMPEESLWWLLLALPLSAAPVAAAEALFLVARRLFDRGRPFDIRPYARWVAALPLPLYALIIFVFGWPKIVVPLGLEQTVLIDHLVVLLPYFVLQFLALVEATRIRRPMRLGPSGPEPVPAREVLGTVSDVLRHVGLILIPLFAMILLLDLARDTGLRLYFHHLPLLSSACLLLALLALAVIYPVLFRYGMGLKPLVKGAPLRLRLEELAARLGFRCRDILYWSTRRPVFNAAIVGFLPHFRYVVLTEELCKRLTLEELGAVFAHEVGHGKRHHAPLYLVFSLAFLTALVPLGDLAGGLIQEWSAGQIDAGLGAAACVYLPAFAFYWLALFGVLSRRFELEADVFGVESTRDPALFITTLEKVARLARIERLRRAPRHFSIAGRTDFLRRAFVEREPGLLEGFRRKLRLIRRGLVLSSSAVLLGAALWLGLESVRGYGTILLERGEDERAARVLGAVVALRAADATAHVLLAEIELYRGPAPGDVAGVHWSRLEQAAKDFAPLERAEILAHLRMGWARAVGRGVLDAAARLVERARVLNRGPTDRAEAPFDPELEGALLEMAALTAALEDGDQVRVAGVLAHPPRWLRRADVAPALRYLEAWDEERNSL